MSETKEAPALKPNVQELSDKLIKGLEVNKTDGVISETRENYIDHLPEGITKEIDAKVDEYRTEFVAASAHAVGSLAVEALVGNKKLDTVTAELKMGQNGVRHSLDREQTLNFGDGPFVKHGVMRTKVDIKGAQNSGQLKTARQIVGDIAAERISKKK